MLRFEPSRELSRRLMHQLEGHVVEEVCVRHAAQRLVVGGEQRDQLRKLGRVAVPVHVGFGEADVAVEQYPAEEAPVLDLDLGEGLGRGRAEHARRAVRKPQGQAADGQTFEGIEDEARGYGHSVSGSRASRGGAGLR